MKWNAMEITDHNRSPLSVDVERIEKKQRMANGTLRKYWIADKKTFSCSWTMLPSTSAGTVDGFAGGSEIEDFYLSAGVENGVPANFELELYGGDIGGEPVTYDVMFSDFSKQIVKRGSLDFWDISIGMEEV